MIVEINAFRVSMNLLQSDLSMELSTISFINIFVAIVKWKSKIYFWTKFNIRKLKIDAFSIALRKNLWTDSFIEHEAVKEIVEYLC